jgi:hypothetical protein
MLPNISVSSSPNRAAKVAISKTSNQAFSIYFLFYFLNTLTALINNQGVQNCLVKVVPFKSGRKGRNEFYFSNT